MRLLLALFLSVSAQAAPIPDLELLRSIAADQGVSVTDLPPAPKAQAAPAQKDFSFEGLGTLSGKSSFWLRPKTALTNRSISFDGKSLPHGAKPWAWIQNDAVGRSLPNAGRAWVKGQLVNQVLQVSEYVLFPEKSPELTPAKAQTASLETHLVQVSPWCDHMPAPGAAGVSRQHLVLKTRLTNKTDKPLKVSLARLFVSLDAKSEGVPMAGLSIRGRDGLGTTLTDIVLDPAGFLTIEWRGEGLYPEGSHDKTVSVLLQLSANGENLFVRGAGAVIATN